MARDNFSGKTVELLRTRVASRCSDPDCDIPTTGPGSDTESITSIGIAAHIHAASPGGPRYLAEMTPKERRASANGIWLCAGCSIKIDRDVQRYPADLLRQWKVQAEVKASARLGKPQPRPTDAMDQLRTAFTGHAKTLPQMAISNVHTAAQQVLEDLDPRFKVLSEYKDGKQVYTLRAKQNVPFRMIISQAAGPDWKKQLTEFFEHGTPVKLDAMGVEFHGSPLFDATFAKAGTLMLEPYSKKAVLKLSVVDEATSALEQHDDITGEIAVGRSSITFTGSGFGDVLKMSVRKTLQDDRTGNFRFGVGLDTWVGRDVRFLPYFDAIYRLYSKLANGWSMDVKIEVQGMPIFAGRIKLPGDAAEVATVLNYLRYTHRARVLASHVNQPVYFQLEFLAGDHMALAQIVAMIEGKHTADTIEPGSSITCRMHRGDDEAELRALLDSTNPYMLRIDQAPDRPLTVYNQPVTLPTQRMILNGVKARILEEITDEDGECYLLVEWLPVEGFTFSRELLKPSEEDPSAPIGFHIIASGSHFPAVP